MDELWKSFRKNAEKVPIGKIKRKSGKTDQNDGLFKKKYGNDKTILSAEFDKRGISL